jgi:hypothetical protein
MSWSDGDEAQDKLSNAQGEWYKSVKTRRKTAEPAKTGDII